jgi:DNA-binding NarL/FixJ family response regulator
MIRVDILERSPIFLLGLMDLFTRNGFEVSAARTSSLDGRSWRTDVFVVDPGAIHGATFEEFAYGMAKIGPILLTLDTVNDAALECYLRAGVTGVVGRAANSDTVLEATRVVVRGGHYLGAYGVSAEVEAVVAEEEPLSPWERRVLRHTARGLTPGQIARLLGISRHTVDAHVSRIRGRLGLGNTAGLTRAAVLGNVTLGV